ncbi:hypothetical protein [Sporosarcina sp. P34]|uniref:hypothetical protein n=1 Tax=Sporosarcina sp. P34 TaxID=2048247 RepID=UPI0013043D28|nr:hypothetical protein [Sporosarcina sp. P34]
MKPTHRIYDSRTGETLDRDLTEVKPSVWVSSNYSESDVSFDDIQIERLKEGASDVD